jgi:hypothetical protein
MCPLSKHCTVTLVDTHTIVKYRLVDIQHVYVDCLARSSEELSFDEGEILYVTDDIKYKDWYLATTNNNRTGGLIPKNYGRK